MEHTVHSVTLTRSVKRFASPSSFSRLDSNILDIFLCILLSCSFPTHCLPLPRLPAGCGTLKCLQFFNEVCRGRHDDGLRIRRSGSMGRPLQPCRPSDSTRRSGWSIVVEGPTATSNAIIDDPILPLTCYVQVSWLIKVSPSNHVLVDHKE